MIPIRRWIQPVYILVILLLLILVLTRECGNKSGSDNSKQDTIINIDTLVKHDTIRISKNINPGPPDSVVYNFTDTVIMHDYCDSLKAMVSLYDDTLWNDSRALIKLKEYIQMNRITSRHVEAKFFPHDTLITRTIILPGKVPPPRNKVFIGFQSGILIPDKVIFSPTVSLCTKKDHVYQVGYDPINKAAMFGMLWKIRLSRRPP